MEYGKDRVFKPTPMPEDHTIGGHLTSKTDTGHMESDIDLTHRLFEYYYSSQHEWDRQANDDQLFYMGSQWNLRDKETLEENGHKAVVINVYYQMVEHAVAMLTHNRPSFRVTGRGDDDQKAAEMRNQLLTWIWQNSQNNCGFAIKTAIRDYYVRGRGVLVVGVDPDGDLGKGEVFIKDFDPQNVYVSEGSQSKMWDDADHIITRMYMTKTQIRMRWPHIDVYHLDQYIHGRAGTSGTIHREFKFPMRVEDSYDPYNPLYEVIERYTKVKRTMHRLFDPMDSFSEELLDEEEGRERLQDPGFIEAGAQGNPIVIKDHEAVAQAMQLFMALGGNPEAYGTWVIYHFSQPAPPTGPEGEPIDPSQLPPEEAQQAMQPVLTPGPEENNPMAIPGSTRILYLFTIGEMVQMGALQFFTFQVPRIRVHCTVGNQEAYPGYDLPTSHYPVIPILNNHNRSPYTISDTFHIRPLQELINKMNSLILAHTANSTNTKVFVPDTGVTDIEEMMSQFSKVGTAVLQYASDPSLGSKGGIEIVHPAPLQSSLFEHMNWFIGQMEHILGIYSMQQGDPAHAPPTYRGTVALDEFATRRIKNKQNDIYDAIARAGTVALDLAACTYDHHKVIRLVNPSGDVEVMQLTDFTRQAGDFKDKLRNRYDVIVVAGSTLPSNRWAMSQYYMELFQMGAIDMSALLAKLELPDAEAILQRHGELQQMQQLLEQMQQEIKKLNGDMQTLERENRNSRENAELANFKAFLADKEARITQILASVQQRASDQLKFQQHYLGLQRQAEIAIQRAKASTSKS